MSGQLLVPKSSHLPGLDLLKFSMAIVIVALHSRLFKEVPSLLALVNPLYVAAVPVFFTVSAYLFFSKADRQDGFWTSLLHYLRRMGVFYLFWFVVMLPVTVLVRKWHVHFGAGAFFRCLFFQSTFRGSYFVMALMLGIPVVAVARKIWGTPSVLFLSLAVHMAFKQPFEETLSCVRWLGSYSFAPALVWMAIGALLAEDKSLAGTRDRPAVLRWLALFAVYAAMCLPALRALRPFLRITSVVLLFAVSVEFRPGNAAVFLKLRELSILVFVTHFVFATLMDYVCAIRPALDNGFLHFAINLGGALAVSLAFLRLKGTRLGTWLKWGL